jgi:hypothetical protein
MGPFSRRNIRRRPVRCPRCFPWPPPPPNVGHRDELQGASSRCATTGRIHAVLSAHTTESSPSRHRGGGRRSLARGRGSVGRVRRRAASVCESRRRARESVSPATNAMPMASTGRRHGSPSRLPPCPNVPPMATNCTWRAGDLRSRRGGGGSIGRRARALWPASTAIPEIVTDVRAVMLDVAVHPRRAVLIPST